MKDRSDDPPHHGRTLLSRSYIWPPPKTNSQHLIQMELARVVIMMPDCEPTKRDDIMVHTITKRYPCIQK